MHRLLLILLLLSSLTGCFRLNGIEHKISVGMERGDSGGEVFAESPSGHRESNGGWNAGTSVKTIWGR